MADYNIGKAFERIENELISSMMGNLKHHKTEETKEGFQWSQWQVEQLKALENYKKQNKEKFSEEFLNINENIGSAIEKAYEQGGMDQEIKILKALQKGYTGYTHKFSGSADVSGEFFKVNERKINELINATVKDMEKAETAVLRMANDKYRKIIFDAQVYANAGGTTYEKAVDMATHDFLSAGINCIEYKNGARHTISDYADMAIKTANKRAYLRGEGTKRAEWGIHTVIVNKRGNACPLCLPFVGKVLIDDVYSGGSSKDGKYPLLSTAISQGFLHPRCKDSYTTYFEGISIPPKDEELTQDDIEIVKEQTVLNHKKQNAEKQAKRMDRLSKYSLDEENKKIYGVRSEQWKKQAGNYTEELKKSVEKSNDSGIIKSKEVETAVSDVHNVGKIDRRIYSCITKDIVTDEVIITDERIQHIKDHHPKDFERYYNYLKEIVTKPKYIIEANKPNSALILKSFSEGKEKFKTVLRIITSTDNIEFKNSIITFMKINEKEWKRLINNKKILYKSE